MTKARAKMDPLPLVAVKKYEYADAELSAAITLIRDIRAKCIIGGFEEALAGGADQSHEILKACGIERQPGGHQLHASSCIPRTEDVVLKRLSEPPQALQMSVERAMNYYGRQEANGLVIANQSHNLQTLELLKCSCWREFRLGVAN